MTEPRTAAGRLTEGELDAIRQRDANAQDPARTWAVDDRRRLLHDRDTIRAAALDEARAAVMMLENNRHPRSPFNTEPLKPKATGSVSRREVLAALDALRERPLITTVATGCACREHAEPCKRRRRKNRRYCSACIEYCQ